MSKLNENLMLKRIGIEFSEQVLELVKNHYSEDNALFQMMKCDLEETYRVDTERALNLLSYGLSVGIFEKNTNRLVAVCLNVIKELNKPFIDSVVAGIVDPGLETIFRFIGNVESDLLQLLEAQKILYIDTVTVMAEYRNQGLLKQMVLASVGVANKMECEYAVAMFVTAYFPKNVGFRIIKKVKYSEYVDEETGLRPFNGLVVEPHNYSTVVALPVPNITNKMHAQKTIIP